METVMRYGALAVTGALLALTVRSRSGEFAALVSIAAVAALGVAALEFLKPVLDFAETLRQRAGLETGAVAPVLKTLAIGIVTETGGRICRDAGASAVGGALELLGGFAAFYVLLPLMQNLLTVLDQLG